VASPRASSLVVALFLTGALSSCASFVTGMGGAADASLQNALQVGVDGFAAAAAPPAPTQICQSSSDPAVRVDATLQDPASAGYTDGDAELDAWAWRASSPEAAAAIVDRAVAGSDACEDELYADYDTDGDGQLDSGSSTITSAERVDGSGWHGVAVRTVEDGDATAERRYVRRDDVVVLVALSGGDDPEAIVGDYLDAVAGAL
jgi:hypothetical protein